MLQKARSRDWLCHDLARFPGAKLQLWRARNLVGRRASAGLKKMRPERAAASKREVCYT
jgi:hypothetical protein